MNDDKPKKALKIGFKPYMELIQKVADMIYDDGFIPDHIAAIARGGLLIGLRLSYILNKPLPIIGAERWPEGIELDRVEFARHVVYKTKTVSGKVLLADDLTEKGISLPKSKIYLQKKFPKITEIRTATVYHKEWSKYTPDYFGEFLKMDADQDIPWIINPFENPEIMPDGIEPCYVVNVEGKQKIVSEAEIHQFA